MIKKILFWLENSRLFSLPMTLLSWLVIFVYSLKSGGNVLNGLVALIGISCAHLATNLFDDYVDYKKLTDNSQKCKCAYIKDGKATLKDVLVVVIIYCAIACFTGLFLLLRCGFPVVVLGLIGGIITLVYAKLSQNGLSELAVGTAFGPLLFEGVYFVMTGKFSLVVFVLSLAVVMFTIGLLYVHTLLDFEGDMYAHKKTLVCRIGDKNVALKGVYIVYGLGYLFTLLLAFLLKNYFILLTFLLIPFVFDMYNSLKTFTCGDDVKEFYFRLLKARNLMVYYSLLITLFLLF
jgi:1,4-dihydroxy-2-naphthoate polyprenyltransferase